MKKLSVFLIIAVILLGFSLFYFGGFSEYVSLEYFKLKGALLKHYVTEHYIATVIGYIMLFSAMVAMSLPVTAPSGVLAGFLFGLFAGFIYAMIVVCIGATISFLIIKHTLSHVVRMQYKTQLDAFNAQINQYGFSYLMTLHLLTIVPYFLINTLAALANVPFKTFLWTTIVGAIPSVFMYVFAGQQLYEIKQWGDIISWHMLAVLGMLALLALMPIIVRKLSRIHNQE